MRLPTGRKRKDHRPSQLHRSERTLRCELLEARRMLANIAAVDASLVDASGMMRLDEVVVGQKIGVRLDWVTAALPSNIANYQVEFRVDGVPLRSDAINYGAGSSSSSPWWYKTGWYASLGAHTVEVVVDVDNAVAENDETDNTFTFTFTSVTPNFPQLMIWPMELQPFSQVFWTNYNDVDPTSSRADLMGGNATYDGHNGIDTGLTTYAVQDQGVEIYAALDGVVRFVNDGEFDRETENDGGTSNYVILDHGDGWETAYHHMRRDSVQVEVGQVVSQGDRLGLVGSSGSSGSSHLHFEVRYHGLAVETHFDQASYWITPHDYVFDRPILLNAGVANYDPGDHFWEGPSDANVFAQRSDIRLFAFGYYSGLQENDVIQTIWRRPSGATYATRTSITPADLSKSGRYQGVTLPTVPDLGIWTVDYMVNGLYEHQEVFVVTPQGEPEIRVEQSGGEIVVDGRFTPISFSTTSVGAVAPPQTFTVVNHGDDTLTIDSLQLPAGYALTEGLGASIAPGAADTFTVALSTVVGGHFGGQIKISSNDEDEAIYNFAVEGIVASPGIGTLIVGIAEFDVSEGGRIVANIRRTGNTTSAATVILSTDDPTELSLPATVSFLPGSDYAQFFIEAPSDDTFDGLQQATVFAGASGYYGGQKSVGVIDDVQQTGDFTDDGLVDGADFLAWQRGASPDPLSASDLNDWQENFGNSPPGVAAISTSAAVASQLNEFDRDPTFERTSAAAVDALFAAGDFTGLFTSNRKDRPIGRPLRLRPC